jgi:glycosyltransferase involved in cell wall biosynthesis
MFAGATSRGSPERASITENRTTGPRRVDCEFVIVEKSKKLRVYVLTPSFMPERGGQEIHLQQLAEGLAAAGVAVKVLAAARLALPADHVDTVPVIRFHTFGETQGGGWRSMPRLAFLFARMTWRLLRDARRYDVVFVSGFNLMPMVAVAAKLLLRKPCVVRPESPLELQHTVGAASREKMGLGADSWMVKLFTSLRAWTAARVDRYVAISADIRARLTAEHIDPRKIRQIPNGIDTRSFVPADSAQQSALRKQLGLPEDRLLLIYTGRIALSKGVMMLLEAWRDIAPHRPEAHLVLVGEGAGSVDDCETQARDFVRSSGIAERVTFAGAVTNVHEYLRACDVFVFPSDYEGFGLSILEAMAVGLPMVCTRVGVAADLEKEAGIELLVPPKQTALFTEALSRVVGDAQLRDRLGRRAAEIVEGRYSIGVVARLHKEVFAELIEART